MNRTEFMAALRKELSRLSSEEIEAAIEYYEEYFDEAGPENEQQVIESLGSPKKVAAQIRSEYGARILNEEMENPPARKKLSAVWWVVLGICTSPISIPLIGLAICGVVVAVAVAIAILAGIAGGIIGAVAFVAIGIISIPVAFSTALFFIGVGLASLAVLAILGALCILGIKAAVKAIARSAKRRGERRRAEKQKQADAQSQWKYKEVE